MIVQESVSQAERVAIIVEEFSRCNFTEFCTAPGSRNTPLVLAGLEHSAINFRVFHDERSMAFFALGMARTGKTIPVVLTTSGTAVANLLPAIIEARADAVPMFFISADRPACQLGRGANQTIIQTDIFGPETPTFTFDENLSGTDVLELISSLRQKLYEDPGPVHINLPLKKPLLDLADLSLISMRSKVGEWYKSGRPWKDLRLEKQSADGVSAIGSFDTIIVGANHRGLTPNLERTIGGFKGDTFFDIQSGSWTCGSRSLSAEVFSDAKGHGRLLILGHRFTEHRVWDWIAKFDYVEQWKTAAGIFDPNGDIDKSFDVRWHHLVEDSPRVSFSKISQKAGDKKLTYSTVVSIVTANLSSFQNVHLANSLTIRAFDRFRELGEFSRSSTLTFNRGASGIDGTLATGLGTAFDGTSTLVVCGDHAFLYDLSILADIRRMSIQATIIIVDNDGGRIFEHLPVVENEALEKFFVAPPEVDLNAVISAFGFACQQVNTTSALSEALSASYVGIRFLIATVDPKFDLKDFYDRTEERFS